MKTCRFLYAALPDGHIAPCQSICPVPTIYSKSERRRNFKFGGNTNNWQSKFKVKRTLGTKTNV